MSERGTGTIGAAAAAGLSGYFGPSFKLDGTAAKRVFPDDPSLEPASAVSVSTPGHRHGRCTAGPGAYQYLVDKGAAACIAARISAA